MTATIETALRRLSGALAIVAGIALILMMVQTVADILMKNLLGRPIEGNLEIVSVYHMVAIVFLPLAFVEMRHEHITVDLVVRLFPRWLRRATDALGYAVATVFFGILAYQTGIDAYEAWQIDEILMTSILITIWPAKFSLPIGFAAVMLASALHCWRAATDPVFDATPAAPDMPSDPS